jgi:hypothetical protein
MALFPKPACRELEGIRRRDEAAAEEHPPQQPVPRQQRVVERARDMERDEHHQHPREKVMYGPYRIDPEIGGQGSSSRRIDLPGKPSGTRRARTTNS